MIKNNIKTGRISYKNITYHIYYIVYVTIKNSKYVKLYSVNPLYLMLNKMNGYFEEIDGNNEKLMKNLALAPTNERKEKV